MLEDNIKLLADCKLLPRNPMTELARELARCYQSEQRECHWQGYYIAMISFRQDDIELQIGEEYYSFQPNGRLISSSCGAVPPIACIGGAIELLFK